MEAQTVRVQGETIVGHATEAAVELPVGDGEGTQRRIVIILVGAGIVVRDPAVDAGHIAAGVDQQGCLRGAGGDNGGIQHILLPVGGGFADLPAGILHPHFGQEAGSLLMGELFDLPAQAGRVMGHHRLTREGVFIGRQHLLRHGGSCQQHQAAEKQQAFTHEDPPLLFQTVPIPAQGRSLHPDDGRPLWQNPQRHAPAR